MSKSFESKRELIMATAKSLFIEKGFRGTTISAIADKAGIAKGSVYSYFDSKLQIVNALFLQNDEQSQHLVDQLLINSRSTGVDLLEQYLVQELQQVFNERAFIQVFLNDELVIMNEEVISIVQQCRVNYHLYQQQVLLQAYDSTIEPWLFDIVSTLNGLLQEYNVYITLDDGQFSINRCANLIAFCLDCIIQSFITSNRSPLFTKDNFPLTQHISQNSYQKQKAMQVVESIKQTTTSLPTHHQASVLETIELLENEIKQETTNATLVRALVANLRPYSELESHRCRLAQLLDVELI